MKPEWLKEIQDPAPRPSATGLDGGSDRASRPLGEANDRPIDLDVLASLAGAGPERRSSSHSPSHVVEGFYEGLCLCIRTFEDGLEENQEVAIKLFGTSANVTLRLAGVGYREPCLIVFEGSLKVGQRVRLVQHVSQANFLLTPVARTESGPRVRVKFEHHF